MSNEDVKQIRVGGQPVGILGLKAALEEAASTLADRPDPEIEAELVKRLSRKNYIPDRARGEYGKALLREFKLFLGRPVEALASAGPEVKILGPGCANCDQLERNVMAAMTELNAAGDVEHVRDIKEIGKYGVMGSPALLINGKVKSVGKVPRKEEIKIWLQEAKGR